MKMWSHVTRGEGFPRDKAQFVWTCVVCRGLIMHIVRFLVCGGFVCAVCMQCRNNVQELFSSEVFCMCSVYCVVCSVLCVV